MKSTKISIVKLLFVIFPITFLVLIIWLALVYFGKKYFHSNANAGQFLLWLISGIIIFLVYPLLSKILLSKWISKKTLWNAITDIPQLQKSDLIFITVLHLICMIILYWIFSDIETHINIHNYFVEHFGKGTRGQPRFPIMITFMAIPLLVFTLAYLIILRVKYGTFNEPIFTKGQKDLNFIRKRVLYFSFVLSTSITVMLCYILKMILILV